MVTLWLLTGWWAACLRRSHRADRVAALLPAALPMEEGGPAPLARVVEGKAKPQGPSDVQAVLAELDQVGGSGEALLPSLNQLPGRPDWLLPFSLPPGPQLEAWLAGSAPGLVSGLAEEVARAVLYEGGGAPPDLTRLQPFILSRTRTGRQPASQEAAHRQASSLTHCSLARSLACGRPVGQWPSCPRLRRCPCRRCRPSCSTYSDSTRTHRHHPSKVSQSPNTSHPHLERSRAVAAAAAALGKRLTR